MAQKQKMVTLVTTKILTPYKEGEVFTVTEEEAEKLLRADHTKTDFGERNPEVRVRLFDPERDQERLLTSRVLNQEQHAALAKKLNRPDLIDKNYVPEKEPTAIENILGELDEGIANKKAGSDKEKDTGSQEPAPTKPRTNNKR